MGITASIGSARCRLFDVAQASFKLGTIDWLDARPESRLPWPRREHDLITLHRRTPRPSLHPQFAGIE